jgi:hypothetical protein
VYPAGYRHRRADEIVGTYLDIAAPGQTRPTLADAVDLVAAGLRQRLGIDADLAAGWALAGPVALALAAGLSGFLWLSVEPLFGAPLGGHAAPAAYATWLLALAGWLVAPRRYARWPVALAVSVTALVTPVTLVTGEVRPPLWVVLALLGFGAIALTAPVPAGATVRLGVLTGALVTAALAKWLLAGQLPATPPATGYYQPVLSLAGLVVAGAVMAVAAGGVLAALEGRRARPWLWAALLLALPGGWLGPRSTALEAGNQPGFGRLAEVVLATCVVLAAMAALSGVRGATDPAVALHRAGGVALGCGAGLAAFLWLGGERPGYGWGPTHAPWAYGAWLAAALGSAVLPVTGRRIAIGLAALLTLGVALVPSGPPVAALLTLVLLGTIGLLDPARRSAYPLPVALATLAAAAVVALYDNGWRPVAVESFGHTAALVLTLAIVPFTLAALAGARALGQRAHRIPAVLALLTGTGWVGALTLPHVSSWSPIVVLIPLAAGALGALLVVRGHRARVAARRALAEGRYRELVLLARALVAEPGPLVERVLAEAHRQRDSGASRLRARLVRAALGQPPPAGADPLSLTVQGLPAQQRIALGLRYGAELSTVDIARLLDVPPGSVPELLDTAGRRLAEASWAPDHAGRSAADYPDPDHWRA